MGMHHRAALAIHRCTVHGHSTPSTPVTTGHCQWFVPWPLQANPMRPWERATAGASRRPLSTGASRGHRGITPKLWQGCPPICRENKCFPMIGHAVDWGITAVGRCRQTESSLPTDASLQGGLFGVSIHPSFALSGLFKPRSRCSSLYLLHICIYMRAPIFTAFQAAHSVLRLRETENKVSDAFPSWIQRDTVGSVACTANAIPE